MANNTIPDAYEPIVQLLEDADDGAHTHGLAAGLVHNNEANLRLDLPALAIGTELEITVTGRNAVGESAPTAAVTALLP